MMFVSLLTLRDQKSIVQCSNIFKSKKILSFCTKFGQCMGNLIRNMENVFSHTLLFFVIYRPNPDFNPKKSESDVPSTKSCPRHEGLLDLGMS